MIVLAWDCQQYFKFWVNKKLPIERNEMKHLEEGPLLAKRQIASAGEEGRDGTLSDRLPSPPMARKKDI